MQFLTWTKEEWATVKEHSFLCISLLAFGFVIGFWYQSQRVSDLQQVTNRISQGKPGYRDLTNLEIKNKTNELVAELRELAVATYKRIVSQQRECDSKLRGATSEQKETIRENCMHSELEIMVDSQNIYNERLKTSAILLRGELLQRLPKDSQPKIGSPFVFNFPTNTVGMEAVATSLEALAKLLPDR